MSTSPAPSLPRADRLLPRRARRLPVRPLPVRPLEDPEPAPPPDGAGLAPPDGAPVYRVDALEDTGHSLHDVLGRLFRRPRWIREEDQR